jgi:hypothetical protein
MFYPCSCRYVQPCTPIYDLTPRDAVVHGQFFYSSSTSQLTALAIVHGFIRSPGVNQASSGRFTFLRRLMAMWVNRYRDDPMLDMSSSAHIPNTCNADGLKDIMAIGNVLELATILDRRSYVGTGPHWTERIEMGSSRAMYRRLQTILAVKYVFRVGGQLIVPVAVFQRSLVEFAAAIVVYKEDMEATVGPAQGYPASRVKAKMVKLFESNHPELLPKLLSLIDSRVEYLNWNGPPISIERRAEEHQTFRRVNRNTPAMLNNRPQRDFTDFPIYSLPAPGDNNPEQAQDEKPEEELVNGDVDGTQDEEVSQQQNPAATAAQDVDPSMNDGGIGAETEVHEAAMDVDPAIDGVVADEEVDELEEDAEPRGGKDAQPASKNTPKRRKKRAGWGRKKTSSKQGGGAPAELSEKQTEMAAQPSAASSKPQLKRGRGKKPEDHFEKLSAIAEEGSPSNGQQITGTQPVGVAADTSMGEAVGPPSKRLRKRK